MYLAHFQLDAAPFSITPDPRFVYLSAQHQDALAHLRFGLGQGGSGGFVVLTGEVGTGKTTLSRLAMEQLPPGTDAALILNPNLDARELLEAITEELGIVPIAANPEAPTMQAPLSAKQLTDQLNVYLLARYQAGRRVVVILDEAQNLPRDTLEQIRLLTNLETDTQKLLQIILLGQPELNTLLARQDLRQLAQRITARFHLYALNAGESRSYLTHRLQVAGAGRDIISAPAACLLHKLSQGVPRVLSTLADRALLAAYTQNSHHVEVSHVRAAAQEVLPKRQTASQRAKPWLLAAAAGILLAAGFAARHFIDSNPVQPSTVLQQPAARPSTNPGQERNTQVSVAAPTQAQIIESWLKGAGLPAREVYLSLASRCPDTFDAPVRTPANPLRCGRGRESARVLQAMQPAVLLQTNRGFRLSSSLDESHGDQRFAFVALFALPLNIPQTFGLGYSGPGVARLAKKLAQFDQGPENQRIFGPKMQARLQAWQAQNGLEADGIVGPSTWLVLSDH